MCWEESGRVRPGLARDGTGQRGALTLFRVTHTWSSVQRLNKPSSPPHVAGETLHEPHQAGDEPAGTRRAPRPPSQGQAPCLCQCFVGIPHDYIAMYFFGKWDLKAFAPRIVIDMEQMYENQAGTWLVVVPPKGRIVVKHKTCPPLPSSGDGVRHRALLVHYLLMRDPRSVHRRHWAGGSQA